jgi:hypothetical protein
LRHSSIVRQLQRNIPIRIIAGLHDTSVLMIERNYSAHITHYTDEIARTALLDTAQPADANVIPIARKG